MGTTRRRKLPQAGGGLAPLRQCLLVAVFSLAMAWTEAAAVMYLRVPADRVQPYQVNPFPSLPAIGWIELVREAATLVMLAAVGMLAGTSLRSRFGFFLIAFGLWDIGYYLCLKWMGGWPASLLDWDVLFLLPLPWWGPVLAPVLISLLMITLGGLLSLSPIDRISPQASAVAWAGFACGALLALTVFIWDAAQAASNGISAVLQVLPERFLWPQFLAALGLMALPLLPFERPRGSPPAGRLPDGGGVSIGAAPRKETADDRPQP